MWQMLRVYGVGGKLLKAVKNLYIDSRACVTVSNDVSEWFPVIENGLCDVAMVLMYIWML